MCGLSCSECERLLCCGEVSLPASDAKFIYAVVAAPSYIQEAKMPPILGVAPRMLVLSIYTQCYATGTVAGR